jgi:Predicted membrane protein
MSRLEDIQDSDARTSPQELARLAQSLKSGQELTAEQHSTLERLLKVAAKREPAMVAQVAIKQEIFSGPLPHPDQLNMYDDATRASIVEMAVKEQSHNHSMQSKGLSGAILKDRLGQIFGFGIAISGLGAAAWISQYSGAAAAIIGTLDLLGMVGVFVVPRAFERRAAEKSSPQPQQPSKRNRAQRKK